MEMVLRLLDQDLLLGDPEALGRPCHRSWSQEGKSLLRMPLPERWLVRSTVTLLIPEMLLLLQVSVLLLPLLNLKLVRLFPTQLELPGRRKGLAAPPMLG